MIKIQESYALINYNKSAGEKVGRAAADQMRHLVLLFICRVALHMIGYVIKMKVINVMGTFP